MASPQKRADSLPRVLKGAKFPADPPKAKLARLYWRGAEVPHLRWPGRSIDFARRGIRATGRRSGSDRSAAGRTGSARQVRRSSGPELRALPAIAIFVGESLAYRVRVRPHGARQRAGGANEECCRTLRFHRRCVE